MPSLTLTVSIKDEANNEVSGFPIIRRFNVTQLLPFDGYQQAADNNSSSFHNAPNTGAVASDLQCFVLTADELLNLKFNNGGALTLSPEAVLVIFGSDLQTSPFCQVNNPAAATAATLNGLTAGT